MPRQEHEAFDDADPEDDEEPSFSDREAPDESDMDEDDDPAVVPCPYCGKPISEDAEICPRCGSFILHEDGPHRRHPWWVWIALVLCLAGVLLWVI